MIVRINGERIENVQTLEVVKNEASNIDAVAVVISIIAIAVWWNLI